LIQQRVSSRELIIHSVVGNFAGYTAVAKPGCPNLNEMLEGFKDEFERVYNEGLDSVKIDIGQKILIDSIIQKFLIPKE